MAPSAIDPPQRSWQTWAAWAAPIFDHTYSLATMENGWPVTASAIQASTSVSQLR